MAMTVAMGVTVMFAVLLTSSRGSSRSVNAARRSSIRSKAIVKTKATLNGSLNLGRVQNACASWDFSWLARPVETIHTCCQLRLVQKSSETWVLEQQKLFYLYYTFLSFVHTTTSITHSFSRASGRDVGVVYTNFFLSQHYGGKASERAAHGISLHHTQSA